LVQLVAHHREVTPTSALAGLDGRGLLASMRFDSCGIWLVGGVFHVSSLSVDTQCVMAAMHPALLHMRGRGEFRQYTRGYQLKSYMKPSDDDCSYHRAREVPSDHALDLVLACWRAHSMELVRPNVWQWEMNPSLDAADPWVHCANCLPKTGEQMEAKTKTDGGEQKTDGGEKKQKKQQAILTGLGVVKSRTAIHKALL